MSLIDILYSFAIKPLQLIFELIFAVSRKGIDNPGLSIIVLSLAMNLLVLPLYMRADALQEEERKNEERLKDGVNRIKRAFKGDERMMMLQTYYRQNGYKTTDVFKGSVSLLLEIPFFIAAYRFLSTLTILNGAAFGPIHDLGAEDALLTIGANSINLLPIIMTSVNLVSCAIFTKGYPLKTKIQLYGIAVIFLVLLYKSPSGLVFYWTLNNVFSLVKTICYKIKNIKSILTIGLIAVGTFLMISVPFMMKRTQSKSFLICLIITAAICFVPAISKLFKNKINFDKILRDESSDSTLFFWGGFYLSVMTGILIPSAVMKSSPQEFVDIYNFQNPIWFVVSSFCFAFGLFVVWFGVFYRLADKSKRGYFELIVWIISGIATINYMAFGKNTVILDSSLHYTDEVIVGGREKIINLAVCIVATAALYVLLRFFKKKLNFVYIAGVLAIVAMSVFNIAEIEKGVNDVRKTSLNLKDEMPNFSFSKTGKNVVVFMLDRAMGEYIPYFVNENPELKEMYSGFTYYPNTLSFGQKTNIGAPPLYGGYEYTPTEINKRDTETIPDKHDEAIKLMPVLFMENGYEVTVCDPTYAGYQYTPDLSVFDEYPDINTYITKGYFADSYDSKVSDRNYRNFFVYALMKIVPLCIQNTVYDSGKYFEILEDNFLGSEEFEAIGQYSDETFMTAHGLNQDTYNTFSVLENMINMTKITDDDTNHFLMMSNDSAHDCSLFQEPDYVVSNNIDNTEYEKNHRDRYTLDGITLEMETGYQYIHYQSNMASLLALGKWLEYLKEQGVYDNTRIIIVSDHGSDVHHNPIFELDDGSDGKLDTEIYRPLLLIKDFNESEFTVDESFMTNADVPTYAFDELIDNPVNPFTGKNINNDEKFAHPQYVFGSDNWDILVNNKETFDWRQGIWFEVSDDVRDKNNFTIINDYR